MGGTESVDGDGVFIREWFFVLAVVIGFNCVSPVWVLVSGHAVALFDFV